MGTKITKTKTTKKTVKTTKVAKKSTEPVDTTIVPEPGSEKQKIIAEFATKKGDTGSPEVQIALLTKRIEKLVGHLKGNPSDNHSRRGLLGMVSKRRRLLNYLADKNSGRYKEVASKLKLTK